MTWQQLQEDWERMLWSYVSAETRAAVDACWVRPASWGLQWVSFK